MTGPVDHDPNLELGVVDGHLAWWAHAGNRRYGWHHLHEIARYGSSFRSARVARLETCADLGIASRSDVAHFCGLPWFSAMVVTRGRHILFERYAPDFGPGQVHSIQSISKTLVHMVCARLHEEGLLDLTGPVDQHIPEIGTGYRGATVQSLLNMDVSNDYSEDFSNPAASYFRHEEAMGWRLAKYEAEPHQRGFLCSISSQDVANSSGVVQYKDANSDVLAWICERVAKRPLRSLIREIVDAAGLAGTFYITTDCEGVPGVDGGVCLSARDLARYMAIFARWGSGIDGRPVASRSFLASTLGSGIPMSFPYEKYRYSNHLMVREQTVGHGGWGGQFALANLETGVVAVFLSVIENAHAVNTDYLGPITDMLHEIAATCR